MGISDQEKQRAFLAVVDRFPHISKLNVKSFNNELVGMFAYDDVDIDQIRYMKVNYAHHFKQLTFGVNVGFEMAIFVNVNL